MLPPRGRFSPITCKGRCPPVSSRRGLSWSLCCSRAAARVWASLRCWGKLSPGTEQACLGGNRGGPSLPPSQSMARPLARSPGRGTLLPTTTLHPLPARASPCPGNEGDGCWSRASAVGLFLFQRWRVRSLHESCQSLWASSGSKLLGLPLGLLGRAHGRWPPRRRAGEVGDARSGKESGAVQAEPPFPPLPPPRGSAPCAARLLPCSPGEGCKQLCQRDVQGWGTPFPSPSHDDRVTAKLQPVSKSTFAPSVCSCGVNPGWAVAVAVFLLRTCHGKNADPGFLSLLPPQRFLLGDRTTRLLLK